MAPTHAVAGAALALPLLAVSPELALIGGLAGLLGGIVPDLDLYAGHRRTLHFPVYGLALALVALAIAAVVPSVLTVAVAWFLLAGAVHSASDVIGGGLELRPWEGTSSRAVYDHHRERWLPPKRLIRYDGAPEDFAVASLIGAGVIAGFGPGSLLGWLTGGLLAAGLLYTLVRKRLPAMADWIAPRLPPVLRSYLPERYH